VGFFKCGAFGEAREFAHDAQKAHGGHAGDEGVVLRHVAETGFHFVRLGAAVEA